MRNHRFTERHPVIAAILAGVFGFLLIHLMAELTDLVLAALIPGSPERGAAGAAAGTVLALAYFRFRFRPEYLGAIRGGETGALPFWLGAYALFLAATYVRGFLFRQAIGLPSLSQVRVAFIAGITEEAAFRGMMIPILMRGTRKGCIRRAAVVSSVLFGLIHAMNLLAGANPLQTTLQITGAAALGVVFAGIYLTCGNILIPMAIHAVHDIVAASFIGIADQNGILIAEVTAADAADLGITLVFCAIAVRHIARKESIGAALRIFSRKWSRPQDGCCPGVDSVYGRE